MLRNAELMKTTWTPSMLSPVIYKASLRTRDCLLYSRCLMENSSSGQPHVASQPRLDTWKAKC